jgi:pimeloyl-ACP methyl ester carboxylesterase
MQSMHQAIFPSLYLIPGLGADQRLFGPQLELPVRARVLPWLKPERGEDLEGYATRMAGPIDVQVPFVLAGVSFGGVLAMEMARLLRPRALVLISSCRTPEAIPSWYRAAWAMSSFCPPAMLKTMMLHSPLVWNAFEPMTAEARRLLIEMLEQACPDLVAAGMAMLMRWRGTSIQGPVHQVHGEQDKLLPADRSRADLLIPGAGHLANFTHPASVNEYLMRIMDDGA